MDTNDLKPNLLHSQKFPLITRPLRQFFYQSVLFATLVLLAMAFEPSLWELDSEIRKVVSHLKDLINQFPTEMRSQSAKDKVFHNIEQLQQSIVELTEQSRRNEDTCRIATWDLKQLTRQCAKYEKRIASISETILHYQFDVITFQGIADVDALTDLMKSMNMGRKCLWKTKWCDVFESTSQRGVSEKAGFMWNSLRTPIEGPIRFTHYHDFDEIKRRPVSLEFYVKHWKLELINFHLRSIESKLAEEKNKRELNTIHEILHLSRQTTKGEYCPILLGNFNCIPERPIYTRHYTLFSQEITDIARGRLLDNILVEPEVKKYVRRRQVVDIKVQPGIAALEVSDRRPMWIDLECYHHQPQADKSTTI